MGKATHGQTVVVYGKTHFKISIRHAIYPVWLMLIRGAGILCQHGKKRFLLGGGNLVQQLWGERNFQCAIFLLKGKTSFSVRIGIGIWEVRLNIVNRSTVH